MIIFLAFVWGFVCRYLFNYVIAICLANKYGDGPHHCCFCEYSFTTDTTSLGFEYCPYCGRPLTRFLGD